MRAHCPRRLDESVHSTPVHDSRCLETAGMFSSKTSGASGTQPTKRRSSDGYLPLRGSHGHQRERQKQPHRDSLALPFESLYVKVTRRQKACAVLEVRRPHRGTAGWEGPRVRTHGSTHPVSGHRAGSLRCSHLLYAHRLQSKSGFGKGFYYFTIQLVIIYKNLCLCIQKNAWKDVQQHI